MSVPGRILDAMGELAVIPAWVVPAPQQVVDMNHMAFELATKVDSVHASGQLAAVGWVTGVGPAPMTRREDAVTWAVVRAESWVALCHAAQKEPPTAQDWERLGVPPRPLVDWNIDFAHGAWRTLAWLLGVHPEPPGALPNRLEDGSVPPGEQRYGVRPNLDSPIWRTAEDGRLARNQAEALRHWRHVRERADAT